MVKVRSKNKKLSKSPKKSPQLFKNHPHLRWLIPLLLVLSVVSLFITHTRHDATQGDQDVVMDQPTVMPSPTEVIPTIRDMATATYDFSPQQWQSDAYIVSKTFSDGTTSTGVAGSVIYASHNTNDVLVHDFECCGGIPTQKVIHYNHTIIHDGQTEVSIDLYNDIMNKPILNKSYPLSEEQKSMDPKLEYLSEGANATQELVGYTGFSFPKDKGPMLIHNLPSSLNSLTMNGQTFNAERYTIQIVNTSDGFAYVLLFSTQTKATAEATILGNGTLDTFKLL